MSLNFPSSPSIGQVYAAEGVSFVWTGTVWAAPPNPFPWATRAEAIAAAKIDRVMTPDALDATLDTFGPLPPMIIRKPQLLGAARVAAVNYENTESYPLLVAIVFDATSVGSPTINVGPTNPASFFLGSPTCFASGRSTSERFIVPPGWFYRINNQGGSLILNWWEYRF